MIVNSNLIRLNISLSFLNFWNFRLKANLHFFESDNLCMYVRSFFRINDYLKDRDIVFNYLKLYRKNYLNVFFKLNFIHIIL